MTTHLLRTVRLAALAVFLGGCSVTIVDPGAGGGGAGSGGGGQGGSGQSSSGTTKPVMCEQPAAETCSCKVGKNRIECSPSGDKIECVCTFGSIMSGICFEDDPSHLCDFEHGCCAIYFSGQ